jgi:hypothetical protein
LAEGAVEGQSTTSNQELVEQHIKKYTGAFMGMAPELIGGSVIFSDGTKPNPPGSAPKNEEDDKCG